MGTIVSKKEFADLIGKSPKHVSDLIGEGLPVEGGGGRGKAVKIDAEKAINWLIQRSVAKHGGDAEGASDEDKKLKRARRIKLELEIDALKKEVLPFDVVEDLLLRIGTVYTSQLDAIASRVAADVALLEEPALCREVIFDETRRVRAATADSLLSEIQRLRDEVSVVIGDLEGDRDPAPET
jgi:phage terminase Nu1 subunit (DNA packaging protein)